MNHLKRKRVQVVFEGEDKVSLTQQHQKGEADINNIVARHMKQAGNNLANIGNPNAKRQPIFGDFSDVSSVDFHVMQNLMVDIQSKFEGLSSRLRGKFHNDPYQLLRWLDDDKNIPEAVALGLIRDPLDDDPFIDDRQLNLVKESAKAAPPPSGAPPTAPPSAPAGGPSSGQKPA